MTTAPFEYLCLIKNDIEKQLRPGDQQITLFAVAIDTATFFPMRAIPS